MIGRAEMTGLLQTYAADVDRAAFRLAHGVTGQTGGGYFSQVKGCLVDAMWEAVADSGLPSRGEWEQAVAEDEAFEAGKHARYARERGEATA